MKSESEEIRRDVSFGIVIDTDHGPVNPRNIQEIDYDPAHISIHLVRTWCPSPIDNVQATNALKELGFNVKSTWYRDTTSLDSQHFESIKSCDYICRIKSTDSIPTDVMKSINEGKRPVMHKEGDVTFVSTNIARKMYYKFGSYDKMITGIYETFPDEYIVTK